MNFEDEDYRRQYVRRTVTSKRLGWEGRAVRNEMLTEFDRAGVWEFTEDAARDIADLVELPLEVVQVGLTRLLATRTWVMTDNKLVWPRFVPAQTCPRSDRIRQQELRERRRDEALSKAKPASLTSDVTDCHAPSRESRNVTPILAELSLPPEQRDPPTPVEGLATVTKVRTLTFFVPDGWQPNDLHRMRCQELRFDLAEIVARFRRTEFQRAYSDWDKRFELWVEDERLKRETAQAKGATRQSSIRSTLPGSDIDTTGAATAFRLSGEHWRYANAELPESVDLEALAREYRARPAHASKSTTELEHDFLQRLKCLRATGRFVPEGPLPRPPRKPTPPDERRSA